LNQERLGKNANKKWNDSAGFGKTIGSGWRCETKGGEKGSQHEEDVSAGIGVRSKKRLVHTKEKSQAGGVPTGVNEVSGFREAILPHRWGSRPGEAWNASTG